MIALKLFCAVIVVLGLFVLWLIILSFIPDFIVFLKDVINEVIYEWKNLPRRLR